MSVNGEVVRELGARADAQRDEIAVDGERLARRAPPRTIVLHKPRGVVSTLADPEGRPTVRELVAELGERVYPVGRLDLQASCSSPTTVRSRTAGCIRSAASSACTP